MKYLNWESNKAGLTAATASASTSATGYPASNLKTRRAAEVWRSTTLASQYVEFDLGAAQSIDFIALVNHNIANGVTITVRAGSSAAPNGSQFNTTITWREHDAYVVLAAAQSWRYWRILFSQTLSPDSYFQIGMVLLGAIVTTPKGPALDHILDNTFINREQVTAAGVIDTEPLSEQYVFSGKFTALTETQFNSIRDGIHEPSSRSVYPLFIIPRNAVYDGYFMHLMEWRSRRGFYYEIDFSFLEAVRGLNAGA